MLDLFFMDWWMFWFTRAKQEAPPPKKKKRFAKRGKGGWLRVQA